MLTVILALAWPTMLEQLLQTAVQYIDTAMVGSLGTQATAAVGATGTVNWLVSSTVSALGIGFLAVISQAKGAGDKKKKKKNRSPGGIYCNYSGNFLYRSNPVPEQQDSRMDASRRKYQRRRRRIFPDNLLAHAFPQCKYYLWYGSAVFR